jgi:hypothetical protein
VNKLEVLINNGGTAQANDAAITNLTGTVGIASPTVTSGTVPVSVYGTATLEAALSQLANCSHRRRGASKWPNSSNLI